MLVLLAVLAAAWTPWEFRAPGGGVGSARWERVKEPKGIRAALAAVKTLPRSEGGSPGSCELRVEKRMTPDVDVDGRGDALFWLEWVMAGDGTLPKCRGGKFIGEDMSESDTDCSVETTRVLDPAAPEGLRELSRTSERSGCPP